MREEDILDNMFGSKWKSSTGEEYKLWYCDLCECFSIGCNDKNCHGSTCNCGGCDKCGPAFDEFCKCKIHVKDYLNEEEKIIFDKIHQIKKHMRESLYEGEKEINWKRLLNQGKMSRNDEKLFDKELNDK